MFGGPPPPPSAEALEAQEQAAKATMLAMVSACVILYFSPFAVDLVTKLV